MKLAKLIFKINVFALLILTYGCSSDFLDKQPVDSINTGNYPETAEDLVTLVNGAYQPLQRPKLYNMRMWTTDIMAGNSKVGGGGGDDGIETKNWADFVTTTDNEGVLDLWRGPWPGILAANIVIDVADGMDIDDDIKKRSLGEAYFLRAHYYFILVRFFGDVPLVLEPTSAEDDLLPPRDSREEVYLQIIDDYTKAADLLPKKSSYGENDLGRATKGAAYGMLAKVYLTLENYEKAVEMASEVEGLGYALEEDYKDNFSIDHKNGKESIFAVQYAQNGGFDFFSDENQGAWTSTFMGPRGSNFVAGSYGWNEPTQEFVDLYEEEDRRKDITILYENGPDFDGKEYDPSYSGTGFNVRKFLVPLSVVSAHDNVPMNFPVLRFADVLLMKAEALNELGETQQAVSYVDKIRVRAGLKKIASTPSKSEMREAILNERRIELAFEGQRWFDLIRIEGGQYAIDFLHSIGKNNMSKKFLLFPIPQRDIDRNPNLSQNPGY